MTKHAPFFAPMTIAALTLISACNTKPHYLYLLTDVTSPYVFKPGDRNQYDLVIQKEIQPQYSDIEITWSSASTAQNIVTPEGKSADVLIENLTGSLGGLETVFNEAIVRQDNDGTKWLMGFIKNENWYWFIDANSQIGIPFWPIGLDDETQSQSFSTTIRRCPFTQPTSCSDSGTFNTTMTYLKQSIVATNLADFETYHFRQRVSLSLPSEALASLEYEKDVWYYPGIGEVKFWLTLFGADSSQILGAITRSNIALPKTHS